MLGMSSSPSSSFNVTQPTRTDLNSSIAARLDSPNPQAPFTPLTVATNPGGSSISLNTACDAAISAHCWIDVSVTSTGVRAVAATRSARRTGNRRRRGRRCRRAAAARGSGGPPPEINWTRAGQACPTRRGYPASRGAACQAASPTSPVLQRPRRVRPGWSRRRRVLGCRLAPPQKQPQAAIRAGCLHRPTSRALLREPLSLELAPVPSGAPPCPCLRPCPPTRVASKPTVARASWPQPIWN